MVKCIPAGQDQVSIEFSIVLSTHIWIHVKGKDKVCCLNNFVEYAEAYQKAKSLVWKHFFLTSLRKCQKSFFLSVISLHSQF